jgi:transcriptional regulator with XRE-family HTH domain
VPPARSPLAQALREARQTTGLTQEQLGKHLGLKGRAIYRWERDESRPNRANQQRVLALITSLHQPAAAKLSAAMADHASISPIVAPSAPAPLAAASAAPRSVVEHSVFSMADELDLPARRVRGALSRWLRRVREAELTLDVAQRELDSWIADAQ